MLKFIGKWVVLQGDEVVTSGSDPKQLQEDARAKGDSSPFLIFVSPDEQEPFAGDQPGATARRSLGSIQGENSTGMFVRSEARRRIRARSIDPSAKT
jgi:hypothetical protein